jgi:hypothetical protein
MTYTNASTTASPPSPGNSEILFVDCAPAPIRSRKSLNVLTMIVFFLGTMLPAAPSLSTTAPGLVNPGFEETSGDGAPIGWIVLNELDPRGYGAPEYKFRFDAVQPATGVGGHFSPHCLSFPARGTWSCPAFTQSNGDGKRIDGRRLAKAAVCQTVELPAGSYRFSAWMRTAEGHLFSAAFSLGVNPGPPAPFANDGSTGIRWTRDDLAMRRSFLRDVKGRGEWSCYCTDPFQVDRPGTVTVWIRFNYVNENQMEARWQVDDVAIVPARKVTTATSPAHTPCPQPGPAVRWREVAGDQEPHLVNAGASSLEDASQLRLFRRARVISAGDAVEYRFPRSDAGKPVSLLVAAAGDAVIEARGATFKFTGPDGKLPTTREWTLPASPSDTGGINVALRPAGSQPLRLFEMEVGWPGRSRARLFHVEADTVAVPWVVGSWDASEREFAGSSLVVRNPAEAKPGELAPSGRWEVHFDHSPTAGRRYYLIHGLLGGTGRIDVGADGIVDWVAESKGEEIVDLDVTELLQPGPNTVLIEASAKHDFAALVETCPGAIDLSKLRVAFEGDELATLFTRVIDNTWFWLRELHYEPSGFIDASIPKGKWYSQYWPVDMAFALREWVRWGHHDESAATGALISGGGWHGHASNRSGGSDNTGGNVLVLQLCEILRRGDGQLPPEIAQSLWARVRAHCNEVVENARKSPFGLIRGTNWENAGNHEEGACYALSTTLGAAMSLRKAAEWADQHGDQSEADLWRKTAGQLREAVFERLVLKEDHRCPSGFVLPKGTWAYGLRTDGTIEDQPLAGYFWAGADLADVEGLLPRDEDLLAVYDRTLAAALPLFERGQHGVVSGYAVSYDGAETSLVLAALCDRIDALDPLIRCLSQQTDAAKDEGSEFAELSRWAYGRAGDAEDTNLVCAAGFLWGLRILAGVDDLLADGRQLRLVPRLPWKWNRLTVNDWPVRARDANGRPRWTRLSFEFERNRERAHLRVRSTDDVSGLQVRLGPFAKETSTINVTVDGHDVSARPEIAGDAAWAWARVDSHPTGVTVQALARP